MKVCVYWNFHKKLFSLVSNEGNYKGKVIGYCEQLKLENVTFKVSQSGRDRVLKEKKKNVHAKIYGDLLEINIIEDKYNLLKGFEYYSENLRQYNTVTYNPYKYKSFVEIPNETPIEKTNYVLCQVEEKKGIIYNKKC